MNLGRALAALRKRWIAIVLLCLLGLAGGAGATAVATKQYEAQANLFVSIATKNGDTGSIFQSSQFAITRVKSYTDAVDSPDVLNPVIKQLGLDTNAESLATRVTAVNPDNTVQIIITVTDTDPARAASITNLVATQFAGYVEELERPRDGALSPVKLTTTRPATVPTSAFTPRVSLNLALGLIVGAWLGVTFALVREQFDTRVKSAGGLQDLTGMTALGLVSYNPDKKKSPLVTLNTRDMRAEAYATIRTNLDFVDVDKPPRRVVITSAVPEEGKTTTACNIAISLAQGGRKVCLIEADLRRPKITEYLGIEGAVGVTDVLAGKYSLDEALIDWNDGLLTVLAAGTSPPDPSALLGSAHMRDLLDQLVSQFDVLIIDAPPLLPVIDAAVLAQQADGAILVARHGHVRADQIESALASLRSVDAKLIGTVMTFVPRKLSGVAYGYTSDSAPDFAGSTSTGSIPGDDTADGAKPSGSPLPVAKPTDSPRARRPRPRPSREPSESSR